MITLEHIAEYLNRADAPGSELSHYDSGATEIKRVVYDSRLVTNGDLFVALRGRNTDGHTYIPAVVAAGASAVVVDQEFANSNIGKGLHIPLLITSDTRKALPYVAAEFYGHPSQAFDLIGVTGTNGKTTVTYMIAAILRNAGYKTAVVGTVGVQIDGEPLETNWSVSTTPESIDLQALFAEFRAQGVQKVIMEVTSIAIDQERTSCCAFDTAIFTNLTQDHLDYHESMDQYSNAKERLFTEYGRKFGKPGFSCAINADDATGVRYAESAVKLDFPVTTYAIRSDSADITAQAIRAQPSGTHFHAYERKPRQRAYSIALNIGGLFNVYNALAAICVARQREIDPSIIQQGLAMMMTVPGRFEPIKTGDKGFHVLVDYAHTPDGLENVLKSARALSPKRLLVVFGCGGNRDTKKRPIMGKLAVDLADRVIVTSDNPRREDPDSVIADILAGIESGKDNPKLLVESDRRAAIHTAICNEAKPGDIVVIAGKGHETYQIIGDQTFPFDDRAVAAEAIRSCA